MEETKVKKREWVKTAAIIFLAVLLVLTFFSNTIMNASLPEVATARVENGSINAKIRGSGTVSANESYEVMLEQSHKVESVLVRVGQTVKVDDPLILLEAKESAELKTEQDKLDQLQQTYDKALAEAANAASKTDREIEVARNAYNDAVEIYNQYSTMDATTLAAAAAQQEQRITQLKNDQAAMQQQIDALTAQQQQSQSRITALETEISGYDKQITDCESRLTMLNTAKAAYDSATALYQQDHDNLVNNVCKGDKNMAAALANDLSRLTLTVGDEAIAKALSTAFNAVEKADADLKTAAAAAYWGCTDYAQALSALTGDRSNAASQKSRAESELAQLKMQSGSDYALQSLKNQLFTIQQQQTSAQAELDKMKNAATAAETVRTAKKALEDKLFEKTLTDTSSVDIKATAKSIEKQQQVVDKLLETADGGTVRSTVNGVVRSISVTAGQMANAQTSLMTVDVLDRGYIIKIPVETEQSKKVRIGDTAELVNWWGGSIITPTLETIEPDPENPTKKRLLVFRLEGEVEAGQNLTLAIGQKSANFDCLVPNSAVKTDNNGSFVLVITTKSTPLGNRYTATRVDVQELAKDDTKTAVTGLSNGDFVITTSSSPVEAGMQVRLPDNA